MEREKGYYWVIRNDYTKWETVFFDGRKFWLLDDEDRYGDYSDSYFKEINENRILAPNEVISTGEAWNLIYLLAKDSKANTEFIAQMKSRYDIIFSAKPATEILK